MDSCSTSLPAWNWPILHQSSTRRRSPSYKPTYAMSSTRTWGPPFVGGESAYFLSINRNKRSLTLNFKEDKAKEIFLKLAKDADVVVRTGDPLDPRSAVELVLIDGEIEYDRQRDGQLF